MPVERGKDAAEWFAVAMEGGRSPRSVGSDAGLARELEIVAMLRSREGTYASHADAVAMLRSHGHLRASGDERRAATPDHTDHGPSPEEKARAKQRLMALLAQPDADQPIGDVVGFPRVNAAEQTAPIPLVATAGTASDTSADQDGGLDDPDSDLAPVTPLGARRAGRHGRISRPTGRIRAERRIGLARRAGLVSSAALLVMVAFTGAGVFASRDALPGQTLYPLKRTAEAAGLAMTFDDEARAQRNLELAALRLGEIEQLIALRGASEVDPELVRAAMSEFDVAASEGSRALLSDQDIARSGATLQAWAAAQSARLSALRSVLPVPAVPAADTSIALLDRLMGSEPAPDARTPATDSTARADAIDDVDPDGGTVQRNSQSGSDADSTAPAREGGPERSLPSLRPDNRPLAEEPAVEPPPTEAPTEVEQDAAPRRSLPLPGAPITLPPLMPGMPPLTVG